MAWTDYNYQAGPVGGPYTDLLAYCDNVRIPSEMDAPKRGSNPTIAYKDGEYSDPFKFRDAGTFMLDCMVSYTDSSGTITHTDGAPGHVFENLQSLKSLLGGDGELVTIRRTVPHMGDIEAVSEFMGGLNSTNPRMRFVFPMRLVEGSWREQTASSDTESSISTFPHSYTIATSGDTDIGDATFTFTCTSAGANPYIEVTSTGEKISLSGSFSASDVVVVNLRDSIFTLNGTSTAVVRKNRAWFIRLPHNQSALGLSFGADSGTWTMKIDWNNRWL